jgi:hypothetical protein
MVNEPPVRIENRTQLIYLLSEAAELEHGISCCYLFAGFSMKSGADEGVSEEQLAAIQRWKATVMEVAVQEMLHLALVNNLLTAIGGAPHIRRPNLPTSPAMYPESFELDLRPFNEETLNGFIFLERPESQGTPGPEDTASASRRSQPVRAGDIFFDRPQYETVGHLYRGIEDGFRYLAEKYGDERLFVGAATSQAAEYPRLPGLIAVMDLKSCIEAIELIVEQGEGARGENAEGHYARFVAIRREYAELKRQQPSFEPGRPVVVNPYTHVPGDLHDPGKVSLIADPQSVAACNLFDGAYELLIQMLGRFFSRMEESPEILRLLTDLSTGLMSRVLRPLGDIITTLPAGPSYPGMRAGPSFYVPRNVHTPPHKRAAWFAWQERLRELSAYCAILDMHRNAPAGLARIGQTLGRFADRIADAGLAK